MATKRSVNQSMQEIRTHFCDFGPDIPPGVTIVSATATHTPPSGTSLSTTVVFLSPNVDVTIGQLTVTGKHKLSVIATLSDGEKVEILIEINCEF